jgi:outer membrane protein OmpA-like peptidoglycan-associated protein
MLAQKPAELKALGDRAFDDGRWAVALDNLTKYQEAKPGDMGVLSKIGQAAFQLHQPDLAKKYLGYVTGQGRSTDANNWYYWACTQHGLGEWEGAIASYKQFLRFAGGDHPLRANAKDNILRCVSGMTTPDNADFALVENLGEKVNSANDEIAPLPSVNRSNRLFFSSNREGTVGGIRNAEGYIDENRGQWCTDIFHTDNLQTGWSAPTPFSSLQNTSRYEVALDFTDKGGVLHYFRGFSLYSGDIFTDTAGLKDEYRSSPNPFNGPVNAFGGDQAPFFVSDSVIVFASRREGGWGGLDLWASRRANGTWLPALNLGPNVNSPYDETTPFVATDGVTLYFSTNRTAGIGGLDVWTSSFAPETRQWSSAKTLGQGINSPGDDAWFRISNDAAVAYMASSRLQDNRGGFDLYVAYFKEAAPAQPRAAFAMFEQVKSIDPAQGIAQVSLAPLYYTSDRDVLGADNVAIVKNATAIATRFPDTKIVVTVNTDETGPLKFDLYSGIKRAEMVGKSLVSSGVSPDRILLRSAGPNFPIARNFVNGTDNAVGRTLNRRIEIVPATMSGELPMQFTLERPVVSELMAAAGTQRLDEQSKGLLYRVEMATTRQVLTSDALGLFTDVLIESKQGSGEYRYMAGAERTMAAIETVKKDVIAAGFGTATIVAYVNGTRLERAEAVGLVKKYPDLAKYIRG